MEYQDNCAITVPKGSGAYMDSGSRFDQNRIMIKLQMDCMSATEYSISSDGIEQPSFRAFTLPRKVSLLTFSTSTLSHNCAIVCNII